MSTPPPTDYNYYRWVKALDALRKDLNDLKQQVRYSNRPIIDNRSSEASGAIGGGDAQNLGDLSDVTLTSEAAGEALIYDGTDWINSITFLKNATGGLTDYDLIVGDPNDYGNIQIGNFAILRTNYNVGNLDLDGSVLYRSLSSPATSYIEHCWVNDSNEIRMALAISGAGNAGYSARSFLIAGPSVLRDDIVTVGYWQTQSLFGNLACDTGTTGADLGVQNDIELHGILYASGGQIIANQSIGDAKIVVSGQDANSGILDLMENGVNWGAASGYGMRLEYEGSGNTLYLRGGNQTTTNDLFDVGRDSGDFKFYRNLLISLAAPKLIFIEDDASANNGRWDFFINGEDFYFRVVNDADNSAGNIFKIHRTTTTVDLVEIPNSVKLNGGATVDIVRDEDDMASDDANALATQQSIKAYVDGEIQEPDKIIFVPATDCVFSDNIGSSAVSYEYGRPFYVITTSSGEYTYVWLSFRIPSGWNVDTQAADFQVVVGSAGHSDVNVNVSWWCSAELLTTSAQSISYNVLSNSLQSGAFALNSTTSSMLLSAKKTVTDADLEAGANVGIAIKFSAAPTALDFYGVYVTLRD